MTNNDIFKKLRVALQLRDDQILDILQGVDFKVSKTELSAFFRNEKHPNYMECGDQVLRNFLNGLVLHLRGTKEQPKHPGEVLLATIGKNKPRNTPQTKPSAAPKEKDKKNPEASPRIPFPILETTIPHVREFYKFSPPRIAIHLPFDNSNGS